MLKDLLKEDKKYLATDLFEVFQSNYFILI